MTVGEPVAEMLAALRPGHVRQVLPGVAQRAAGGGVGDVLVQVHVVTGKVPAPEMTADGLRCVRYVSRVEPEGEMVYPARLVPTSPRPCLKTAITCLFVF